MGKSTGFLEITRKTPDYLPIKDRVANYHEFVVPLAEADLRNQGARCMDCGIPFCHNGCPINNIIPDWNDLVYEGNWKRAIEILHSTNNFPEFTGRVCPAPCEAACTLNLEDTPVAIKTIEHAIIERAWEEGWIVPLIPRHRSGKRVAVVGSGPAGLAASQQLARAGHFVTLFEKNIRFGGLLRYGIPDFKLEKTVIDRRLAQMQAEGVELRPHTHVGVDITMAALCDHYDAVLLAGGAEHPRDLPVPGRELSGVHFAMDFLSQQNRRVACENVYDEEAIHAAGKQVVVIGGGDTGSDCVGTSIRQQATSVTQIEILPQPPAKEDKLRVWPNWPSKLRTSSSHEEGCRRDWSVVTKGFKGKGGKLRALDCMRVTWHQDGQGAWQMEEVAGSEFEIKAELALLAMGFVHPVHQGMIEQSGVARDPRGNVAADTENYQTSVDKIFAAGDMRRGQSLVVWAIREGRQAARAIDLFLMGESSLPR